MATECKNALRELCSILLSLNIFISEDASRQPNWLKAISRKYPDCLIGSGKDVDADDVKELQKKFNEKVGIKTFGFQLRKSEAYGDSVVVVIPKDTKEALKLKEATGLLEEYADANSEEISFG